MKRLIRKSDINENIENKTDNQNSGQESLDSINPISTNAPSNVNTQALDDAITKLSEKGRENLRSLEDYKFSIEQVLKLTKGNSELTKKINDKKEMVDQASAQIYTVVFDMENLDITTMFAQQQNVTFNPNNTNDDEKTKTDDGGIKPQTNVPPTNNDQSTNTTNPTTPPASNQPSTPSVDTNTDAEPPKKSHHKMTDEQKEEKAKEKEEEEQEPK